MNFGGFPRPELNVVFDINDFDETCPAPFERDLKRVATGFPRELKTDTGICKLKAALR